jgi:O-antigen chain-terminating methyltransferase
MSHKYVGFEDAFRGSTDQIRARLMEYVPIFAGASEVLDIGCGRGEFLTLLREHGVSGRGIDVNDAMVEVCRENGLDATKADALSYLRGLPSGSLGGLFAAQVVEHLEPAYLTHLLEAAFDVLRPGAPVVLETINPACWFAFFESYIRDITHVRPLHPDTLKFLLIATGFQQVEIRYRVPYPDHEKLQPIPKSDVLGDSVETLNANVAKINELLFTHLDYAAIARRP